MNQRKKSSGHSHRGLDNSFPRQIEAGTWILREICRFDVQNVKLGKIHFMQLFNTIAKIFLKNVFNFFCPQKVEKTTPKSCLE